MINQQKIISEIEDEEAHVKLKGDILLHDIEFKYENRENPIFKNFHL